MSVLVHCMQTDSTRTIVRCHYKKCAAQTCWNEILLDAKNSTRANLELMSLHSRLINAKLDSNWRGDVDGFLLFWNNMMARMEELQPVTQQYPWEVKKSLLVSAVNGHPALAAIYKLDQDQIIRWPWNSWKWKWTASIQESGQLLWSFSGRIWGTDNISKYTWDSYGNQEYRDPKSYL